EAADVELQSRLKNPAHRDERDDRQCDLREDFKKKRHFPPRSCRSDRKACPTGMAGFRDELLAEILRGTNPLQCRSRCGGAPRSNALARHFEANLGSWCVNQ